MRIVLVGTDLAPVRPGAGALETLLCGWAAGLSRDHAVTVASVGDPALPGPPPPYRTRSWVRPADLPALLAPLRPDVVVLNNRPAGSPSSRRPPST